MTILDQIIIRIVKEQALIIGPVAWEEAKKVEGLQTIDRSKDNTSLQSDNPRRIIDELVRRYESMFGRASKEVCREAAASLVADLPASEVPSSLQ